MRKRVFIVAALFAVLALACVSSSSACEFCTWKFVCFPVANCDVINICEPGGRTTFTECWEQGPNCYMAGDRCLLA